MAEDFLSISDVSATNTASFRFARLAAMELEGVALEEI